MPSELVGPYEAPALRTAPYDHGRRGTGLVAHPVFKTGRAGQPPAWKVRFLRRVVAGLSPLWRAPCTAQLSRCDSVSGCVGAVRGGTTGVTKTSWCRSAPQFPAGGRAEEARAGKRWSVGRCEADRPNAGSRLEEPRSAHSLRDRGVGQIPSCPRGSARRARLCHDGQAPAAGDEAAATDRLDSLEQLLSLRDAGAAPFGSRGLAAREASSPGLVCD